MSAAVLMFGNESKGVLLAVSSEKEACRDIRVMRAGPLRVVDNEARPFGSALDIVIYEPRRLEIFGTTLRVHVDPALPQEQLEAMLADSLLSDKAKAVIEDRWPR